MNIEVELPDLGVDSGDEATVCEWYVEDGDHVAEGELILEVIAGGLTIDVPSPLSGILIERVVGEGEMVRVGEPLAIIEEQEEREDGEI